jgi:CubicO group peptidase (beta-lactamase class C family)
MKALGLVESWPVERHAVAVMHHGAVVAESGPRHEVFRWASITKVLTAWATLIAVEEGSLTLDDPIGPGHATVSDLLCHAGGYGFDGPDPVSAPRRTRIYSNTGYEVLAHHVAAVTAMPFDTYLLEAVLAPLEMSDCRLEGSPAKDAVGSLDDLIRLASELSRPSLLHDDTASLATTVKHPELSGIVPAVGRFDPCPWGLGPEIKGLKTPHWTGQRTSARTFGHFGGSGTFMWIDPVNDVVCLALTDREMTSWGMQYWPDFADAVIDELVGHSQPSTR